MRKTRTLKPQDRAPTRWITLDAGRTIVTDASLGLRFRVRVTESCTLEPPLNAVSGQGIIWRIEWGALATVTLHSSFTTRGSVVLPTASGSVYFLSAIYDDEAPARWELVGTPDLSSVYDAAGTAAAAIVTHEAAGNPHPTYLTQAEADALYAPTGTYAPLRVPIEHIGSDTTLTANSAYIVDSSAGVRSEALPASPTDGDAIHVLRSGANTVTVTRNTKNINGAASDYDLASDLASKVFRYDSATTSWWTF